jgi:hypothetical protein
MTNEEFSRKVEFLVSEQAKFEARIQKVDETQAKHKRRMDETVELSRNTAEGLTQLIDISALLTNTVVEGLREGFDRMKHTDEKIDVLVNSQIRTDERMRDLFERHIRETIVVPTARSKTRPSV